MSEWVRDKYWRPPMILQNLVLLKYVVPSTNFRVVLVDIEVKIILALIMLVLYRMSEIYLCCERKRSDLVEMTDIF